MKPFGEELFGNPSSLHSEGRAARRAVDEARASVARLINALPEEVVFTGSGTEADNLALRGFAVPALGAAVRVVVSSIEHPAVLETCRYLGRLGVEVVHVPSNGDGIVGLGRAAGIARLEASDDAFRLVRLRDILWEGIQAGVPNAYLIGHRFSRLPGHICLGLAGQEGEAVRLLLALDEAGAAVSSGSACSSNHAGAPSSVLTAMGFDPLRARGSIRISLGRFNIESDVRRFLDIFPGVCASLRRTTSRPECGGAAMKGN